MRFWPIVAISALGALVVFFVVACAPAFARDNGQWGNQPSHIREWFQGLKQPDNPMISCCGEADAVEADEWHVRPDGDIDATVTDGKGYVPTGTVIRVPKQKLKQDAGNPTGHAVLFLSTSLQPYCFIVGSLI